MIHDRRTVKPCDSCLYVKNTVALLTKDGLAPSAVLLDDSSDASQGPNMSIVTIIFCKLSPCSSCEMLLESEEIAGIPKVTNGPRIVGE